MSKKKDKPQVVNHIDEVNLEIDYDKLADAIVKANERTKKAQKRHNGFRAGIMVAINAALPVAIMLAMILTGITIWSDYVPNGIMGTLESVVTTVLLTIIAVSQLLSAVEAWKDDDETALQHFNANIGLAALIVALAAFFKGVG